MPKIGWQNVTIHEFHYRLAVKMAKNDHRSIPNFIEKLLSEEDIRRKLK